MLNMYKPKKLNPMDVLPITVAFCMFVVCNNLSLQYNTVGFYQLMKVLTTPVVVVRRRAVRTKTRSEATGIIVSSLRSLLVAHRAVIVLTANSLHQQQVLQKQFFNISIAQDKLMCLGVICFGVCIATVSDFSVNAMGTFWAVMGLVST